MFKSTLLVTLALLALTTLVTAIPVDNGVEGDPEIECGPTSITVNFNTRNSFEGHVYVKGLYDQADAGCRNSDGGRQVAGIELDFSTCNVRRTRSLNPKGVFVSTTVIVSFHPLFLTKVDRAYRIQCFYMEADKTVDTRLEVSMLTTEFQTQQVPMPICRYEILDGSEGAPVEFAIVGQPVFHKWTCDTETVDTFCMVVRDCFVDDTNGDKVDLINSDGCANDRYLINNPEYLGDLTAGVEAHVFKYADRADLYFQCQITILVKEPNQDCPRPACPQPAGRGAGNANPLEGPIDSRPDHPYPLIPGSPYLPQGGVRGGFSDPRSPFLGRKRRSVVQELGTLDVASQLATLEVEDASKPLPDVLHRIPQVQHAYSTTSTSEMCISPTTFTFFTVVAGLLLVALLAVGFVAMSRKE